MDWIYLMASKVVIDLSIERSNVLLNLLRTLVEGGNNTSEFLSLARQNLPKLEVPTYEDVIELYKDIVSGTNKV